MSKASSKRIQSLVAEMRVHGVDKALEAHSTRYYADEILAAAKIRQDEQMRDELAALAQ